MEQDADKQCRILLIVGHITSSNDGGRFKSARIALATATRDCAAKETRAKVS